MVRVSVEDSQPGKGATNGAVRMVQEVLHRIALLAHDLPEDLGEASDGREVVRAKCRNLPQRAVARARLDRVLLVGVEGI